MNRSRYFIVTLILVIASAYGRTSNSQYLQDLKDSALPKYEHAFELSKSGLVLLPVIFEGKEYKFVMDTGSSVVVYDSLFKDKLGTVLDHITIRTPSGAAKAGLFEAPIASMGKLNLRTNEKVLCMDLSLIRKASGNEVHGIIGMSFLKNYVINIDNKKHVISLDLDSKYKSKNNLKISYKNSIPSIQIALPGVGEREFRLDTGSNLHLNIAKKEFQTMIENNDICDVIQYDVNDINNLSRTRKGVMRFLDLNNTAFANIPIVEGVTQDNRVGLKMFEQFNLSIDFSKNQLVIVEREN